jgi:acyl carrier protein
MELNAFIQNFAAQFEETDLSSFTAETNFKELGEWSSLIALSVIMMVNEEYDIEIGAKEIIGSDTIGDLFDTLTSKKNN